MTLLAEWTGLCARHGIVTGAADEAGRALLERWSEPHRRYHDQRHLARVLSVVGDLGGSDIVLVAAWWHDAVYDPRGTDNEQQSATLAATGLTRLGFADPVVSAVVRLVLLTVDHAAAESDVHGQVLCDADLQILAADPADYDDYVRDVRAEYAFVDETGWRAGRSAVLQQLLDLPQLYRTATARTWEPRARANLSRELASLQGGAWADADPQR